MEQRSSARKPKRNWRITRRIFPPDSEKSSGNETTGKSMYYENGVLDDCSSSNSFYSGRSGGLRSSRWRDIYTFNDIR